MLELTLMVMTPPDTKLKLNREDQAQVLNCSINVSFEQGKIAYSKLRYVYYLGADSYSWSKGIRHNAYAPVHVVSSLGPLFTTEHPIIY